MAASMFNSKEDKDEKRRPSYMPTRGLAAVLNQGLATLGEKLGNFSLTVFIKFQNLISSCTWPAPRILGFRKKIEIGIF